MLQKSILQYFRPSLSYHLSFNTLVLSIFEWLLKTGLTVKIMLGITNTLDSRFFNHKQEISYTSSTVKLVLSGHSKRRPELVFMPEHRLMPIKRIAECSKESILQYFRPSLNYHLSLRYFCLILIGRLRSEEIISTVILLLPLIREGLLSVTSESIA